jgi:hypothetical protein
MTAAARASFFGSRDSCAVDAGLGAALLEPVAQNLVVVAFVGNRRGGGRHGIEANLGHLDIMDMAAERPVETARITLPRLDERLAGFPSTTDRICPTLPPKASTAAGYGL